MRLKGTRLIGMRLNGIESKSISGIICDRKMPVELKDKVFKTIIRPAMTHGSYCWDVKKKDERKLNWAEIIEDVEMGKREDQVVPHQK